MTFLGLIPFINKLWFKNVTQTNLSEPIYTLCSHCEILYSNVRYYILISFLEMFFSNFLVRIYKFALSHVFAFWVQHLLSTSEIISPQSVLDFHSTRHSAKFSQDSLGIQSQTTGWPADLAFWPGQRWLLGTIHFSQHCRASAVAESKQNHNVCSSANSIGCIMRRWGKPGGNLITEDSNAKQHSGFQSTPNSTRVS